MGLLGDSWTLIIIIINGVVLHDFLRVGHVRVEFLLLVEPEEAKAVGDCCGRRYEVDCTVAETEWLQGDKYQRASDTGHSSAGAIVADSVARECLEEAQVD